MPLSTRRRMQALRQKPTHRSASTSAPLAPPLEAPHRLQPLFQPPARTQARMKRGTVRWTKCRKIFAFYTLSVLIFLADFCRILVFNVTKFIFLSKERGVNQTIDLSSI